MSRLLAALLFAPITAGAAPALKDRPPKEMPSIVGEWLRVGHTQSGRSEAPDPQPHHQIFKADGSWEYFYGDPQNTTRGMAYVTDRKQDPPTIDIQSSASGRPAYRGIYKVEGDTLTLCVIQGDGDRPKHFESSADRPTIMWVFKRVQPKD